MKRKITIEITLSEWSPREQSLDEKLFDGLFALAQGYFKHEIITITGNEMIYSVAKK